MKTLVYILPQTDKHKHGTFRDIIINDNGTLRILYIKDDMGFITRLKLKRALKGCTVFDNAAARKIPCKKLRRNGLRLANLHINGIISHITKKMPAVIFTNNISDLILLEDSIKMHKNISIFTTPPLLEEFDSFLLENYGVAAAVSCAASLGGKSAIVMPNALGFDTDGAACVIDFNNSQSICNALRFDVPYVSSNAGTFLKSPDALETALDFFDIDFYKAKVLYVKFNKKI